MRFLVPVYALTLLLSAFLLFSVQPLFSKMILPLLGGAPQVWNTAMLFFQLCLLGGYAYAHFISRYLDVKIQAIIHTTLLSACVFILPFAIPDNWEPPTQSDPTLWQLSVMAMVVGAPFFVVAGSAPLFQNWFGNSNHKDAQNPYFLYGASNLGSMTALLLYPTVIEPALDLTQQSVIWMYGYFILIGLTSICGLLLNLNNNSQDSSSSAIDIATPITIGQRWFWIMLAAIPSSLMLGVTTYVTTDIASAPLLWVAPLALYVGTFIIVFAKREVITLNQTTLLSGLAVILIILTQLLSGHLRDHPLLNISIHFLSFFLIMLGCHKQLAQAKPRAEHLTEFYLLMSFGGVIGGFFNAIIAPNIFIQPIEYAFVIILAVFMRYIEDVSKSFKSLFTTFKTFENSIFSINSIFVLILSIISTIGIFYPIKGIVFGIYIFAIIALSLLIIKTRWAFLIATIFILFCTPLMFRGYFASHENILYQTRNFFGVIKVIKNEKIISMLHGTTNHGVQANDSQYKKMLLSYYSHYSPLADTFNILSETKELQNIGVIGLGVGVVACYAQTNRHFDFYEIDKAVADIAEDKNYFTYLSDCGSPYKIILGDGRISLNKKADHSYDLFLLDAFSSDNIPVHLLTREAIALYLQKLKPDGMIILHISNNYLDLEPVIAQISRKLNIPSLAKVDVGTMIEGVELKSFPSHYVVLTQNLNYINILKDKGWTDTKPNAKILGWSDQYSNIFSVMDGKTANIRAREQIKFEEERKKSAKTTSSP